MSGKINKSSLKDSLLALERRRRVRILRWLPTLLFVCYVLFLASLDIDDNDPNRDLLVMGWMANCLLLPGLWFFASWRTNMHDRYKISILPEVIKAHRPEVNYQGEGRMAGLHFSAAKLYYGKFSRIDATHQMTGQIGDMAYSIAYLNVKLITKILTPDAPGIYTNGKGFYSSYFGLGSKEYSGIRYSISRSRGVRGHVLIMPLLDDVRDTWDERVVHNLLTVQKLPEFSQYITADINFGTHFMVFTDDERAAEELLTDELKQTLLDTRRFLDVSASFAFKNKHLYIHASKRQPMFKTDSSIPFDDQLVERHQKELDHYVRVVERFAEHDERINNRRALLSRLT